MASRNQFIAVYHHIVGASYFIITTWPRMESWGQDTVHAGTFWGVLEVLLCASSTQLGLNIVA